MIKTILETLGAISLDVAIWTLVITLILAAINARRASRIEREENYIQLELASNDLFRFEADNAEHIEPFLSVNKPADVPEGKTIIRSFFFQTLNLFEIAIRLRREDRFGKQAFGTWVIWFYDTCDGWFFREEWPDLRENYTVELREIFDQMVAEFDASKNPELRKDLFFTHVATSLDCPIVKNWRQDQKKSRNPIATQTKSRPSKLITDIKLATSEDKSHVAKLMAATIHSQNSYISHGDYFAGRSAEAQSFVPNLETTIANELTDPTSTILYALAYSTSKSIVGCAAFYFSNNGHQDYCILDDIVVPTEYRSQGVGAALYDFVVEHAQQNNASKLFLESGIENHSAHQFFDSRGFKAMSKTFFKDL